MNNTQIKGIRDLWADVSKPGTEAEAAVAKFYASEEQSRKAWEQNTLVEVPGFGCVSVATLREAFDKVQSGADWKAPIEAQVYGENLLVTLYAIEFYQGDLPTAVLTHKHAIRDRVTRHNLVHPVAGSMVRTHADYIVRSRGYQAW